LLLAVFIAAGMSLSIAQASSMTVKMLTMSEMGLSNQNGCQGCPDKPGDAGMKAMACGNICAAPVLAALPAMALVPASEKTAPFAGRDPLLHGRTSPPDPHPPRTSDIG
jgi:hypothetical protein